MIHMCAGNLLDSNVDWVVHQVNCQGKMGSGIASQIRGRYPIVYDRYINYSDICKLGDAQLVRLSNTTNHRGVINLFSQEYFGYDGSRYTDYEAFARGLEAIKLYHDRGVIEGSIGFPYNIGCGLGGANWNIIYTMIKEILGDCEVYIYKFDK